jgi:hypothetical protein
MSVALNLLVMLFNDLAEIIFADVDDTRFALGVFPRVAGLRGIDHDGRAKFAANGAGGALDGSVGPSTSRILVTAFTPS